MISISSLAIYPVKSLAGVELQSAHLDRFGLVGDRRWMVVNEERRFLSQRELSTMALIAAELTESGIRLASGEQSGLVQQPGAGAASLRVQVW